MQKTDDLLNDIGSAVMALRTAFLRHRFSAPLSIELASHDDFACLKENLGPEYFLSKPSMANGTPEMVACIAGVEIRAPAQFRPRERGGFDVE